MVINYHHVAAISYCYRFKDRVAIGVGTDLPDRPAGLMFSQMTVGLRQVPILIAAAAFACSLAGCASINEKLASGMGAYIPQWAGGLPADAPPRAGTPQYDEYMKERERKRLQPAAEKADDTKPGASSDANAKLDPVH